MTANTSPSPADPDFFDDFKRGYAVQWRVLNSLIIRDLMTRYGRQNVGFLWVVLEPMILTLLVLVLWSYIHAGYEHGMTIVGFVFSGYMAVTLYRHLTNPCVRVFRSNFHLLFHPGVDLLDVFASRLALEFIGTTIAFCVIWTMLYLMGLLEPIEDIGFLIFAWCSYAMFSLSLGLLIAILTDYWEPAERFIAPLQYVSFPLSGTYFLVDWLPSSIQTAAMFNPQVECNEMIRAAMFGDNIVTHYWTFYPLIVSLFIFALDFIILERVRDSLNLT